MGREKEGPADAVVLRAGDRLMPVPRFAMSDIGELRLEVRTDGDGTAELMASISGHGFAGTGSAWFGIEQLRNFAERIGRFPLDEMVSLDGGIWSDDLPSRLEAVTLSIHVYLIDGRGQLGIHVHACQPCFTRNAREADHSVEVELETTYSSLERFSRHMLRVIEGLLPCAVIKEEVA